MRPLTLALPLTLAVAMSSCAAPSAEQTASTSRRSAATCFHADSVRSFTDAAPGVALVSIGATDAWELTLSPGCPNVGSAARIGIVARGGSSRICSGADAELIVPTVSGSGSQRCLVRQVRKLTPQEAAVVRTGTP